MKAALIKRESLYGSRSTGDGIAFRVAAQLTPSLDVLHFEPAHGAASLAAPAISFEDLPVQRLGSGQKIGTDPSPSGTRATCPIRA